MTKENRQFYLLNKMFILRLTYQAELIFLAADVSLRRESRQKDYEETSPLCEKQRIEYLICHMRSLWFRSKMLLGEKSSFDQMTSALYNLVAPVYDYSFDEIQRLTKETVMKVSEERGK